MGVVLLASKALKKFELEEELINPNHMRWGHPPEYVTTWHVTLDHRIKVGYQYHVIWAKTYSEAWTSLFSLWGEDIIPDNQEQLQENQPRKALP